MAHKIIEMMDRLEGTPIPCHDKCKYWRQFPHVDKSCVLSDVFSVLPGEPCGCFTERQKEE